MTITGIEIIRRNPGMAAVGVPVGEKLPVEVGDTVRVHLTVDHRGPEVDGAIWTAIGWQTGVVIPEFIEVFNSPTPVHFDESFDFVTYEIDCDVPITDIIGFLIEFALYGNVLDMYAKIMEVPGPDIFTDICMGAIEVIEVAPPPEYELLEETIYPYAYVYDGPWDGGIFTFRSDPFTPASWLAGKFAAAAEAEVKKAGGRVLETRVYVDKSPLLWTDWRIEVIGISSTTAAGLGITVGIAWWVAVLFVILGLIALIVTATWAWKEIFGEYTHKGLTPELKEPMSRETLIGLINDYEVKLEETKPEFTPKPPEEIEAMSDDELRDYCDQLAEWIVPPVPPVPWELIAVAGVLGLGALGVAALAAKPKGKP